MTSDVWFGAQVPPEGKNFEEMRQFCLSAEALKYDLFTVTDHFMNMANPNGSDRHPLECWTTLSGLAAVTNEIRLGSLVSCYAYRRPSVLAKMATTVDIISGGRLVFGVGAGWHEDEFRGFLGWFPPAGTRLLGLEETVEICKKMFTSERTTYHGKIFDIDNVLNSPQPVQMPPQILIGGGGERKTLRIVAKHADISHFFAQDLKTLERKLSVLRRHCDDFGRNYDEIRKGVGVRVVVGLDEEESESRLRREAVVLGTTVGYLRNLLGDAYGTPEKVAGFLEEYIDKGVELITPVFHYLDDIKLFSEEVISLLK
jgi:F420-dependent oxidoreductase-like protein